MASRRYTRMTSHKSRYLWIYRAPLTWHGIECIGKNWPLRGQDVRHTERYKAQGKPVIFSSSLLVIFSLLILPCFLSFRSFMMQFTSIFAALGLSVLSRFTIAAPVGEPRDVWDPTMTYPDSSTIWYSGKTYTVTW